MCKTITRAKFDALIAQPHVWKISDGPEHDEAQCVTLIRNEPEDGCDRFVLRTFSFITSETVEQIEEFAAFSYRLVLQCALERMHAEREFDES